jgi:SAM-dependent methyltransferase
MVVRRRWVGGAARQFLRAGGKAGRLLVLRDLRPWLRLQFLGVATRTGILRALRSPLTPAGVARDAGLEHVALVEAFLHLGVAVGELRERSGRFRLAGQRARALANGPADLTGLVEELLVYDGPIYRRLEQHLVGEPPGDYLDGIGAVIARSSQLVEPLLGPVVADLVQQVRPQRALDVGCGSGAYLRWIAHADAGVEVIGIDADPDAARVARANLQRWDLEHRVTVHQVSIDELPTELAGPYELILLAQNLYYWPPEGRAVLLRRLRRLASGVVMVATATPGRDAFSRHFDLALRVTKGCWRLPEPEELRLHLTAAGFTGVRLHRLVPSGALFVAIAQ